MEQIAFKIMAFSLVINLAVGMVYYIGQGNFEDIYKEVSYKEDLAGDDIDIVEKVIGSAPVENSDNMGDKILDFFNLALFSGIKRFVNNLLFGFITLLENIRLLDAALALMFKSFFGVIYMAGIYEMFTGKSILGG